MQLLLTGIARQLDDLHPVVERRRDLLGIVGRRQEENLRQVERQLKKMIAEGVVLLGIEHLKQRRGRISLIISAELIDLIEKHQRVVALGTSHRINNPARHRPYVGLAMAADVRLVLDAAERDTHIVPSRRAGDRTCNRGLAHTGRADKAKNLPLLVGSQSLHRDGFQHPLLDLFHPIVIVVKDSGGFLNIGLNGAVDIPWKLKTNIEVTANHRSLLRVGRHFCKAVNLLDQLFRRLFPKAQLFDSVEIFLHLGLGRIIVPKLLRNDLHLLTKVVFLLVAVDLALDLLVNSRFQPKNLILIFKDLRKNLQPAQDVRFLEHLLLLLNRQRHIARHILREEQRVLSDHHSEHQLFGHLRREGDIFFKKIFDRPHQCADQILRTGGNPAGRVGAHLGDEVGIFLGHRQDLGPGQALGHDPQPRPLHPDHLFDFGDHTDAVQALVVGIILLNIALGGQKDFPCLF